MEQSYEGFYARFQTPSKKEGSMMMGADDLVGNVYTVSMKVEDGAMVAWISNKFGAERGFLGPKDSERIQLALARGQKVQALLSFLAYSDAPEPGVYWGQVAMFCFNPADAAPVEAFISRVGQKLGEGVRPKIDLKAGAVKKMLTDPGWMPSEREPRPKKETGTAIIKDHLSATDKMVEQGRARNKGCYVVSWLFIALVVVVIGYTILQITGVMG